MTATLNPTQNVRAIRDTAAQDVPIDVSLQKRRRKRLVGIAVGITALLLFAFALLVKVWLSSEVVVSRERIRIATVQRGQFINDVSAEGTIVAAVSPTLFAPATGAVTFQVKAGDAVKKGQLLATMNSPQLKNEYQREQATLDSLNSALEKQSIEIRRQLLQNKQTSDLANVAIQAAEREFKRADSAWQLRVISEHDYLKTMDELKTARLAHEHAVANARLQEDSLNFEIKTKRLERDRERLLAEDLERRVGELNLHSPVDGMVGSLAVTQSATVTEHAALLTVVDLSEFEVEFRVPESYSDALGLKMPGEITYGDKLYAGIVTAISPEVQQNEITGRVRFSKEAPQGLRQNQRVNLRIVMDSRPNVLKVERGAFTDAGNVAYVVSNDLATRRPIRIGAISASEVEIIDGLTPGEKLIVSSVSDFNNAAAIRISN